MIHRPPLAAVRSSAAPAALLSILLFLSCFGDKSTTPNAPVASIKIDAPALLFAVESTLQLTATPRDAGGAEVSADVSWSTDDDSVATVDASGLVHGVSIGDVRITASADGKSAGVDLAVRELGLELSGRIEKARITLEEGYEYHATGDLSLVADSVLRIDGTLLIDGGVAVALGSFDSTIITGSVISTDTTGTAASAGGIFGFARAPLAERKDILLWGSSMVIGKAGGEGEIWASGSVFIGGVPGSGGVTGELVLKDVEIQGGRGVSGTSDSRNGGPGGSIEIGTAAAEDAAANEAGRAGTPFPFVVMQGSVAMRGGAGGSGYWIQKRSDATVANNTLTATNAGNGGKGGSVKIEAPTGITLSAATVGLVGGNGGGGGLVSFDVSPDRILDGSGPNGEGESLHGTTGSGNDGGDVFLTAGNVLGTSGQLIVGGRGGSPGWFVARGGNGMNGGRGGDFVARIGLKGAGGTAIAGGTTLPEPAAAIKATVRVDYSMSGGTSTSSSMKGGDAGNLDISDIAGTEAGYVEPVFATGCCSGGPGFNGCAVNPHTNGTDGGTAGTYRARGVALGASTFSFLGGGGGNGNQPGVGGDAGQNLDTGQPLGSKGPDGANCPSTGLIWSDVTEIEFEHVVGETACPQLIAEVTITNESEVQVTITASTVGTTALTLETTEFALGPGESRKVKVWFNCSQTTSFTGTVRFQGSTRGNDQPIDIPVTGTITRP